MHACQTFFCQTLPHSLQLDQGAHAATSVASFRAEGYVGCSEALASVMRSRRYSKCCVVSARSVPDMPTVSEMTLDAPSPALGHKPHIKQLGCLPMSGQ